MVTFSNSGLKKPFLSFAKHCDNNCHPHHHNLPAPTLVPRLLMKLYHRHCSAQILHLLKTSHPTKVSENSNSHAPFPTDSHSNSVLLTFRIHPPQTQIFQSEHPVSLPQQS